MWDFSFEFSASGPPLGPLFLKSSDLDEVASGFVLEKLNDTFVSSMLPLQFPSELFNGSSQVSCFLLSLYVARAHLWTFFLSLNLSQRVPRVGIFGTQSDVSIKHTVA